MMYSTAAVASFPLSAIAFFACAALKPIPRRDSISFSLFVTQHATARSAQVPSDPVLVP
jgi:hypothetical protein